MAERWRARLEWAAWFLFMLSLPFTSFPLVKRLTGSNMVAPAALLPLGVLIVVSFLPSLLNRQPVPRQSLPLLAWLSLALFSAACAFFLPIPPYRNFTLIDSEMDALVTIVIGVAFYLIATTGANHSKRLWFLLRLVNWSGLIVTMTALLQTGFWRLHGGYPEWMTRIQEILVTHELYQERASGLAFEPSWLAHQLNLLYLPWWLASSLRGTTVHRLRLGPLTFERFLLVTGILALIFSVSRIGLLGFLLMLAFLFLLAVLWLMRWLENRTLAHSSLSGARRVWARISLRAGLIVLVMIFLAGMFLGAGYALSKFDRRMAGLFNFKALQSGSFAYYANQLVFAERIIFWEAGWKVFNQFPLLGVGPGNAGYFFPRTLSAFSWNLTEVSTLMYQQNTLPNIKSLWVRLLAETGILGFACFLTFLFLHWLSASWLKRAPGVWGSLGMAGMLVIIGLFTEGFSVDTFGLPYYWISLGWISGACLALEKDWGGKLG
uniref:O-antigen ligase-related domain-containing protein n=1 Tax=Anaerolinea thermolimosa TaxID=229919 RepID=A0A7C4KIN6_9CHLR